MRVELSKDGRLRVIAETIEEGFALSHPVVLGNIKDTVLDSSVLLEGSVYTGISPVKTSFLDKCNPFEVKCDE